ncbi:hypothetical protein CBR_g32260 [Chara braunii]|uniref:RING-type domain-containing protein n=1 Tax=Chara braunii TaxID=69332 RepID=A0A388JN65_CHABU|nr:hypothetical protein CBR_g32260 [Chara braunii]|eukprot:GBG59244.1 hypothetical protein CBR_g32260 [Chara braunii]
MEIEIEPDPYMSSKDLEAFLSSFIYHYSDTLVKNAAPRVGFARVGAELLPNSRYSMRAPSVERSLELFCNDISAQYSCPLCKRLMLDASTLNACGHTFCGPCVQRRVLSRRSPNCPLPGCHKYCQKGNVFSPARDYREFLWGLRVKCPFSLSYDICSNRFLPANATSRSSGRSEEEEEEKEEKEEMDKRAAADSRRRACSEVMVLRNLEKHVRICAYRPVHCSFEKDGCEAVVLSRYRALHEMSCRFDVNTPLCETCGYRVGATDSKESHLANKCLRPCPYSASGCSRRIDYADLDAHVATCSFRNGSPPPAVARQRPDGSPPDQPAATLRHDSPASSSVLPDSRPDPVVDSSPDLRRPGPYPPGPQPPPNSLPPGKPLCSPKFKPSPDKPDKDLGRWCGCSPYPKRRPAVQKEQKEKPPSPSPSPNSNSNSTKTDRAKSFKSDSGKGGGSMTNEYVLKCPCCEVRVLKFVCW